MPKKEYIVKLSEEERSQLVNLTKKGKVSARKLNRAHILLLADEGALDKAIAGALHVSTSMVAGIRKRFVKESLEAGLSERPRPGGKRKLDGKQEAFLIALACSDPPGGREHWTMQLLADRLVELKVVDEVSDETVRRSLKRGTLNRGRRRSGAFPQ